MQYFDYHKPLKPNQRVGGPDTLMTHHVFAFMCGIKTMCCAMTWGGVLM